MLCNAFSRGLWYALFNLHFGCSQGVTCCSSTPLSPAQVSAASTPHPSTIAQLPHVHPRPQTCSGLSVSPPPCKRSHAPILSPFHRSRSTRDDASFHQGEAADGFTAAHKRQPRSSPLGAQLSRSVRRSRRVRRCGSLTRPCVGFPQLSSLSARSRLARRPGGRACRRCSGHASYGCSKGQPVHVCVGGLPAARTRAIATDRPAATVWRTAEAASGAPQVLCVRLM